MSYYFSIIVPVYNAEKTLKYCVESILNQTYHDFELILVDDHSADNSFAMCREFAAADGRIRAAQTEGKGVSAARNTGLKMAGGDIIGFCDSDDFLEHNALERVRNVFETSEGISIVSTGYKRVSLTDGQERLIALNAVPHSRKMTARQLASHSIWDQRFLGSVCNKYFRRDVLEGIFFNESLSYCEDMHFVERVCMAHMDAETRALSVPTYNYVNNSNSATSGGGRNGDKLFLGDNQLKYHSAISAIIDDLRPSPHIRSLLKRQLFVIASDTFMGFDLNSRQQLTVRRIMKDTFFSFLIHPFCGGLKKNCFRLRDLWKCFRLNDKK